MKNVLFVCIENSCRSQLAEALTKMLGANVLEAYSSGSNPSGVVNPKAIASMKELDYDLSIHRSKPLTEIPDIEFDYVITMGCGDRCPFVKAKNREDWAIPDPKNMGEEEFREVRNMIESRVKDLIKTLA